MVLKEPFLVVGQVQAGEVVDGKDQPDPVVDQVVGVGIDVDLLGIVGQQHDDRDDREDGDDDLVNNISKFVLHDLRHFSAVKFSFCNNNSIIKVNTVADFQTLRRKFRPGAGTSYGRSRAR